MELKVSQLNTNDPSVVTHRVLDLEDGQKVHFRATNPYGLWSIHFNKGQLPEKLKGEYTSYEYALRDVLTYLGEKDRKPAVKETK